MTTAYLIHNSEGVPIRRIVETTKDNIVLKSRVYSPSDDKWDVTAGYQMSFVSTLGKYSEKAERQHHLFTRFELSKQYGYRFEIYWPLSTVFS